MRGGSSGGGNTKDSVLKQTCSYSFSQALCDNAGYKPGATGTFELCQCPVRNLYAPPDYDSKCVYGPTPDTSKPIVTQALIEQNCPSWCPDKGAVTSFDAAGKEVPCPELVPACKCKS